MHSIECTYDLASIDNHQPYHSISSYWHASCRRMGIAKIVPQWHRSQRHTITSSSVWSVHCSCVNDFLLPHCWRELMKQLKDFHGVCSPHFHFKCQLKCVANARETYNIYNSKVLPSLVQPTHYLKTMPLGWKSDYTWYEMENENWSVHCIDLQHEYQKLIQRVDSNHFLRTTEHWDIEPVSSTRRLARRGCWLEIIPWSLFIMNGKYAALSVRDSMQIKNLHSLIGINC